MCSGTKQPSCFVQAFVKMCVYFLCDAVMCGKVFVKEKAYEKTLKHNTINAATAVRTFTDGNATQLAQAFVRRYEIIQLVSPSRRILSPANMREVKKKSDNPREI